MTDKEILNKIFSSALKSVDPSTLVKAYASKLKDYYLVMGFHKLVVAGFGKASYQMAKAVEEVFGPALISDGIVITKYGHGVQQPTNDGLKKIRVYEAGHPVPDEQGINATGELIRLLQSCDDKTLVLCLVSGGGSALFVSPYDGMDFADKQSVTDLIMKAGADITELNVVRKHLSKVKGGRLAEIVYPAEIVSLMISDVIGDKLDVIASGPTAADTSTYQDALNVIRKYKLAEKAPENVMGILNKGEEGSIPDTPKQEDPIFKNVQNIIIGSNKKALEAAKNEAVALGFETEIVSSEIAGEARDVGKNMAGKAKEIRSSRLSSSNSSRGPLCFVSGGETTVTVKGKGKGGRNTEMALSFAMEIEGVEGIYFLSAGTDGNDGPTDATGAFVGGGTIGKARALGLDPQAYLDNNDSYNFFKKTDSLLITGPTGTNVMDVQVVLIK